MTALLLLMLAITTPAADPEHGDKTRTVNASEQNVVPDERPLQSVVEGISSLGASLALGAQTLPSEDEEALDALGTVVWVRLSKEYVADYVERDVDRLKPVRDYILGTTINGRSRTTGKTKLVLLPNEKQAVGRVEFVGEVHGREIGRKGPATLHFNTKSTFRGHKYLRMGESGIVASPAVVNASTRLTPTSIYTNLPGLRGRIGNRIARRREAGSRPQANRIASDHTAADLRQGFDRRLNDSIAEIQSKVRTEIAGLKLDDKDSLMSLHSRSTKDHIEIALGRGSMSKDEWQQIAESVDGKPHVAVRLHRSLLARALGDPKLREKIMPLIGSVAQPQTAATNLGVEKWAIGNPWVALDLAAPDKAEPVTRVAAEDRVLR